MERKGLSPEQFYNYVTEHINGEDLGVWAKACNINSEKGELFFDFTNSLCDLISKLLVLHLPKTKSELDIFSEIYIILDNNLIVGK